MMSKVLLVVSFTLAKAWSCFMHNPRLKSWVKAEIRKLALAKVNKQLIKTSCSSFLPIDNKLSK
jgi:hypothetical protein